MADNFCGCGEFPSAHMCESCSIVTCDCNACMLAHCESCSECQSEEATDAAEIAALMKQETGP